MPKLIACKDCGQQVSKSAKTCPHCGVGSPARRGVSTGAGCMVIFMAFGFFFVFLPALVDSSTESPPRAAPTPPVARNSPTPAPSVRPKAPKPQTSWTYSTSDDDMAKGKVRRATTRSTNVVNFDFPYGGRQRGQLTLRSHPRYGRDVIFSVEKGQILCQSYTDCLVTVRFDDNKASKFSARGPSDNSSTSVFILNHKRFVRHLRQAKRVRIEVPFYQSGNVMFEFNVDGLKWK